MYPSTLTFLAALAGLALSTVAQGVHVSDCGCSCQASSSFAADLGSYGCEYVRSAFDVAEGSTCLEYQSKVNLALGPSSLSDCEGASFQVSPVSTPTANTPVAHSPRETSTSSSVTIVGCGCTCQTNSFSFESFYENAYPWGKQSGLSGANMFKLIHT